MERDVAADPAETNRRFYDDIRSAARLLRPERLNTWPLLSRFAESDGHALEVGPGRVDSPEVDEIIAISRRDTRSHQRGRDS
jgi:hypothetical protein